MDQGMDMLKNMSPDMMKAGMDMMKNMDPAAIKSMSKMMGREVDEAQLEQMQKMMSNMSPEDMQKWAKRAQSVASVASYPVAAFKKLKTYTEKISSMTAVAVLTGLLAFLMVGHISSLF